MSIPSIGAVPFVPPSISAPGAGAGASAAKQAAASGFAEKLDQVSALSQKADTAATGVATGSVEDIHTFTVAASKAQLGVELTVALRNKAVEAYQDIMRMQV